MLVIADLTVNKADLAIVEDCELRQVYGGLSIAPVLGIGNISSIIAPSSSSTISPSFSGRGGTGLITGILPNPAFSPGSLIKASGLKF